MATAVLSIGTRAFAQPPLAKGETFAEDAAWSWFSDPRAVYYKGEREQVYVGYIASNGDVVIGARDLVTGNKQSFVLHEQLEIDDHNVPSILILPDGRLLVFYTEHNGRFFIRRSTMPEDITEWQPERSLQFGGEQMTYAHPVLLSEEDNRMYVFWRGSDWCPTFAYSDDFGNTWSDPKIVIASNGPNNRPYLKVASDGKSRIDFIFTDGHPSVEPRNSVYHVFYKDGWFHQTDGKQIMRVQELPLFHKKVDKVYDGNLGKGRSWISDICLDQDGRPVIVYTRYPEDADHRYHYAAWDGKCWVDEELCQAGGWMPDVNPNERVREPHYSGGISLDHQHPRHVFLARKIEGTFEIESWKKVSSGWISKAVTSLSLPDNIRPYVVNAYPGRGAIVLWMQGTYRHYTDFNTKLLMRYIE